MKQPLYKLDDLELFKLIQIVNREIHETRKKAKVLNEYMRCFPTYYVDDLDQLKEIKLKLQAQRDISLRELKDDIGYKGIVLNAIEKGYSISVNDGEEWSTVKSTDYKEIIKDIESVDDCDLNFYDKSDKYVGWAKIILCNDYNESVSDYTANDEMESLINIGEKAHG